MCVRGVGGCVCLVKFRSNIKGIFLLVFSTRDSQRVTLYRDRPRSYYLTTNGKPKINTVYV